METKGTLLIFVGAICSHLATKPTKITAMVGASDAFSFAEKWEHTKALGEIKPGKQILTIAGVPASGFIRLQAVNDTGSYITAEAGAWK